MVETASNGAEALVLAFQGAFDAIVLDVDMPALDGIEVARRIRQAGDTTKIVLVTGAPAIADELPMNVVTLRKPFSTEDIIRAALGYLSEPHLSYGKTRDTSKSM